MSEKLAMPSVTDFWNTMTASWAPALAPNAEVPAKTAQAASAAFTAAFAGAEKVRSHLADLAARTMQEQAAAVSALAKVKTPIEAVQLQSQLARQAVEAYTAEVTALSGLMSNAYQDAVSPLQSNVTPLHSVS